jgi:hypothetical protein
MENMAMMTNPQPLRPARSVTAKPAAGKPAAGNRSANLLKSAVAVGAIVATLVGAEMAAQNDQGASAVGTTYTTSNTVYAVTGAQQIATVPNLTVDDATLDQILNAQLAPIPSITIPSVTATSRSSR